MTLFEALKECDLRELLRSRGVAPNRDGKIPATWRGERTPSVHVYADRWHDYGADEGGDFLDWLERAEGLSREQAREEAARLIGYHGPLSGGGEQGRLTVSRGRPKQAVAPGWIDDLVAQAHAALVRGESEAARAARAYFEARKLGSLVEVLRLGVVDDSVHVPQAGRALERYRGRAIIPTLEEGRAVWFKARDLRSADELKAAGVHKYDGPSGSVPAPFNPAGLEAAREAGFVVLTEGETDAASLLAAYGPEYPVLGLPGGALPKGWAERIAEAGVPVYLATDPDAAGAKHAERSRAELGALGVRCYLVRLEADINDMLREHGEGLPERWGEALEAATLESTSDLLYVRETWLAELDARANRPHAAYTTGLEAVDKLLGGGYLEGLHLLGGITAGGKTSLALQIAAHNALEGRPVIFASYEQSRLELWGRIAARLAGVPYAAIKRGTYDNHGQTLLVSTVLKTNESWDKLEAVSKRLKIVEGGDALSRSASAYTVWALATTARAIAEEHGAPPLVIVDYMQRVPAPPELKIRDVRERVGYAAGLLQVNLAREIGCPVLALSSIGRVSYKLGEKDLEERLAALKEAGELEYTAYTTMLIYNLPDELQVTMNLTPGMMSSFRPMTLDVVKNREGDIGRFAVQWTPARGTWQNAEPIKEGSWSSPGSTRRSR